MAIHSSILAWEIPCTEEPAGLQSMGLQIRTQPSAHTHTHTHTHNVLSGDGEESGEGKGSRFWPTAFLDSSDLFSP